MIQSPKEEKENLIKSFELTKLLLSKRYEAFATYIHNHYSFTYPLITFLAIYTILFILANLIFNWQAII